MTIQHHPVDALLTGFVAGTLDLGDTSRSRPISSGVQPAVT